MRKALVWFTIFCGLLALGAQRVWADSGDSGGAGAAHAAGGASSAQAAAADDEDVSADAEALFDELEERLAYLEEAMDVVERRAILDRLQVGADYRLLYNYFRYRGPDPEAGIGVDSGEVERTSSEIWSHRLRVPISGEFGGKLRITARLMMFKHFGDNDEVAYINDFQGSRFPRDSGARFEQAWLDWFVTDWLALSMGRLSYSGVNPPGELRENSYVRNPTWGLQIVDGEYESLNVTFNLSDILLEDLYVRAFYASWFSDYDDPEADLFFFGDGQANPRILGWSLDVRLPKLGRTFLQFGQFIFPGFPAVRTPVTDPGYNPDDNYANLPAPYDGSVLFPDDLPDSLGGYQNFNMLLEALDIQGVGLDAFIGGTIGFLSPNDQALTFNLPDGAGGRVATPLLVMPSKGDTGRSYSFLAGLRYALPIDSFDEKPKLGFEYNYGSRYYISIALPHDQLLSKWANRGHAYEGYAILPVYRDHLFVRAGLLYIDRDWFTALYGPNPDLPGIDSTAPPEDAEILNFNLTLQATL